ncbi:response regulator [bacterium]|nr:response regulator [bacterium]
MPQYAGHITSKGLGAVQLLIVEDQEALCTLLERALRRLGFEQITIANDAYHAMEAIRKKIPDLILTDWMLGHGDGISLTKAIRASTDAMLSTVPIIMISGRNTVEDIQHARDAGITEFVAKPFSLQDICDRIVAVVEKPRMFVVAPQFIGPDRRRTKGKQVKSERRTRPSPITDAKAGS